MNKYKKLGLGFVLGGYLGIAGALVEESGTTPQATQYHMQQAYYKLEREEYTYAWGEFAYLLCKDPANHEALDKMVEIALRLDRHRELNSYFTRALSHNPDDKYVQELYRKFQAGNAKH